MMSKIKRMSRKEWAAYVRTQLDKPRDKMSFFTAHMARAVPISVVVAILASAITIYFWGFREYARMVMQLILGLTLAAALLGPLLKRMEEKFR